MHPSQLAEPVDVVTAAPLWLVVDGPDPLLA